MLRTALSSALSRTLPRLALAILAAAVAAFALAGLAAASGHHAVADTWTGHRAAHVAAAVSWGAKPARDTWT
jgi:hypothetical protein